MKSGWGVFTPFTPVGSCGNMMHTCEEFEGRSDGMRWDRWCKWRGGGEQAFVEGVHLDADGTLSHLHVRERLLQVDLGRVAAGDHVAVTKLHGLGTLGAHLALDNDLLPVSGTNNTATRGDCVT